MKVRIILTGPGGELDRIILDNVDSETDDLISAAVSNLGALAVGDTITITEVE